jgi:hypothetical protein
MCGCFGNACTCVYCVFVLFVLCFCIVSFMYIYSYLFCLYWCKDCCYRVTTELLSIIIIIINSAIETTLLNKQRLKSTFTVEMVPRVCSYGIGQKLELSLNESDKGLTNVDHNTLKKRLINPLWAERLDCDSRMNVILYSCSTMCN